MASSSGGGGGGGGGGPYPTASSSAASLPSTASLDGGFLLRLLQNPAPNPCAETATTLPTAPSGSTLHFFVDPAVAAVGPLFPASLLVQEGGFAWPTPSDQQPQLQLPQQLRFPDPQFVPSMDPSAARGGGGFGSVDAVRAERPRPRLGDPPPGFGMVSQGNRKRSSVVGEMTSREQNQYGPKCFDNRITTKGLQTTEAGQRAFGILGRNPHGDQFMSVTGCPDAMVTSYSEQCQDHILSMMPPDMNPNRPFDRMLFRELLMLPSTGGRTVCGDQHMPQITGASTLPRGQEQLDPHMEDTLQWETSWQGNREETGHASQKLLSANVPAIYDKAPMRKMHHVTLLPGSSFPLDIRNDVSGLDNSEMRESGLQHGVDDEVIAEPKKFEISNQKRDILFIGQNDEDDDGREHDAMVKQLTKNLVISGDGLAKGMELQKTSLRSKDFRSDFSRGHYISSQRVRLQRRNRPCRYDIDKFTPSFLSIFKLLVPSEEEIGKQSQLCATLSRLINKEWPNSRLFLYGSCANSFGFSNSDIDLCLSIDDKEMSKVDIILKLADILEAGNLQNIQALTRARVPIVKLMDPETGLSCDICVNNLLAVVNTKLLKDYAQIDRRLRQLAFIVKHWAKSRRINETYQGTLSSYAYVIMCIHFLQLRRILPCLQEMEATYCVTVDENNCAYFDQVDKLYNYGAHNKDTISRLLWAFFHYWAYEHDYTRDVISVRTGKIISKERKDWTRRVGNDRHLICIEDPFETSHDLGRVVDKFTIKILREEFERAADILQFDANPSATLFEPYVHPPMTSLIQDGEHH